MVVRYGDFRYILDPFPGESAQKIYLFPSLALLSRHVIDVAVSLHTKGGYSNYMTKSQGIVSKLKINVAMILTQIYTMNSHKINYINMLII